MVHLFQLRFVVPNNFMNTLKYNCLAVPKSVTRSFCKYGCVKLINCYVLQICL